MMRVKATHVRQSNILLPRHPAVHHHQHLHHRPHHPRFHTHIHTHINMQHTLSCSSAPPATAPCAAPLSVPPFLFIPHSRAHSLSAGWSCRPGGSPGDRTPASAHGPCRGSATPKTTVTTGACCPATGNKTSPRSTQRSESRWRWPVSCAW